MEPTYAKVAEVLGLADAEAYSMVIGESEYRRAQKLTWCTSPAARDAEAAAQILLWSDTAPQEYDLIEKLGLAKWCASRRAAFITVVLYRARKDGKTFPI